MGAAETVGARGDSGGRGVCWGRRAGVGAGGEVERELEEVERRMVDLVKEREERCRRIMDRRVQQVHTLQELGKQY